MPSLKKNSTNFEDVHLLLLRWAQARSTNRESRVFCVANIDELSYSIQCSVVEDIQNVLYRI